MTESAPQPDASRTTNDAFARFAESCVFVDLETIEGGRVRAIGAVVGPEGAERAFDRPHAAKGDAAALDAFAADATWVAGHNLVDHDLPRLAAQSPGLRLLGLPAVDTLILSPLAFPRRPYHRLVKDYKLVSDAKNDPVADARLARTLLRDEWVAFDAMRAAAPDRLDVACSCLHGWTPAAGTATEVAAGTARFLELAGGRRLDDDAVVAAVARILDRRACCVSLAAAVRAVLSRPEQRPAVAYAVEWSLVADTRSVLPRWVGESFPAVVTLLREIRGTPCGVPSCDWCAENHSPPRSLRRWFGFDGFRGPPCGERGLPMQEEVVRLGFAGTPTLAILPTSFGKSLCYQLPAIARYARNGSLTVVVSPLQALMKDQVDTLERRVTGRYAAAIHGMLTPPERGDVLERVRTGELAMVYVAPEQLRNRSFASAIRQREIGAWVFDEAHCVSKWGHDFRTDYRYAARFIREFGAEPAAPVFCFTATAKHDVRDDIVAHFRDELGTELHVVEAPVDRPNLTFSVTETSEAAKFALLDATLRETLDAGPGSAIVYLATRRRTEDAAKYLASRGWGGSVQAFHAGVDAPQKREIQDAFHRGDVRIICATNAFGMGIDKPDVRLVVHADVPGSLENYLQEAGRAGRDGEPSKCVLLWCADDLDVQFGLLARSRLTQRDIAQVLQAVRRARGSRDHPEVVVTPRELLADERTDVSFDPDDRDARTKVATAVAWLERADFLRRDENHTRVFQGRPKIRDIAEAEARIAALGLSELQGRRWIAILRALLDADDRQGIDFDELAARTGLAEWKDEGEPARPHGRRSATLLLLNTLRGMAREGLIDEGLCLSAFVRVGIAGSSAERLDVIGRIEEALLDVMRENAPDLAPEDGGVPIDLRAVNEAIRARAIETSPETLRRVLHSLADDGTGLAGDRGSLVLSHTGGDRFRVRLVRTWDAVVTTSSRRRRVASLALEAIVAKAAHDGLTRGEVLAAFSMEDVLGHVARFPAVAAELREPVAAVERALLYLHEQKVLVLQKGLAVFRQAMGIRFHDEARSGRYTSGDHEDLRFHYAERVHHAHAMGEYARLGVSQPRRAQELVSDYFRTAWPEFVAKWFADRPEEIERAASREAYRRIVEDLRNVAQQRIVAASARRNLLVLAGPGSGKTRVVVHRCAYLLLVERVPPTSVLVLCFNRAACHELRTRLRDVAGDAARGVQVHTYHGLALRLTGRSLARRAADRPSDDASPEFDEILRDAIALLRGERPVAGIEPDDLRERLLDGYQHVLVDEYQDVDALQYELISAVAGRRGSAGGRDEAATLLAVGDDDQTIYGWRGAQAEYLRRFCDDYEADVAHLVENFRSTAHVVAVANALIGPNPGRMKASKPLRVDRARRALPRGGRIARTDRVAGGRVQILDVADRAQQVAAVFAEIDRIRMLLPDARHADFAVLGRTHAETDAVRAWCETHRIPCRRVVRPDVVPSLRRVREIAAACDRLAAARHETLTADGLRERLGVAAATDPWSAVVLRALQEWDEETCGAAAPASAFAEHLYEHLSEQRRSHVVGDGVFTGTVHAAKGLEFGHVFVLDGGWEVQAADPRDARPFEDREAEGRRTYYVAATRAKETLHLLRRADCRNPYVGAALEASGAVSVRSPAVAGAARDVLDRRYVPLRLSDVDLGFAGRRSGDDPVHRAVASLRTGQSLRLAADGDRVVLVDALGRVVGALSAAARDAWRGRIGEIAEARAFAIVRRSRDLEADGFRDNVRIDEWEVPVVELVVQHRNSGGTPDADDGRRQ